MPIESYAGMPVLGLSALEPMVVHVRNAATAEISVLIGEQEFIYRDPALVSRLVQSMNVSTRREA